MRRALLTGHAVAVAEAQSEAAAPVDAESLTNKTQEHLRKAFSGLLKTPAGEIDPQAAVESDGIDSTRSIKQTNEAGKTCGSLSKTLLVACQTIPQLTGN